MRELSLNVMDVVQNSISADASLIEIEITEGEKSLSISIKDNGRGMTENQIEQVVNPFYTTRKTRNVGLGIPLFKMEAEMTGGSFDISSKLNAGTTITAKFKTDSIDMIPLGDIDSIIHLLVTCNPIIDFSYIRKRLPASDNQVKLDTREIKEILGEDISLSLPDIVVWLKKYLGEQTQQYLSDK